MDVWYNVPYRQIVSVLPWDYWHWDDLDQSRNHQIDYAYCWDLQKKTFPFRGKFQILRDLGMIPCEGLNVCLSWVVVAEKNADVAADYGEDSTSVHIGLALLLIGSVRCDCSLADNHCVVAVAVTDTGADSVADVAVVDLVNTLDQTEELALDDAKAYYHHCSHGKKVADPHLVVVVDREAGNVLFHCYWGHYVAAWVALLLAHHHHHWQEARDFWHRVVQEIVVVIADYSCSCSSKYPQACRWARHFYRVRVHSYYDLCSWIVHDQW